MDNITAGGRRMGKAKTTTAGRGVVSVRDYPITTPDGLTWLDPAGNPPQFDSEGRLIADFLLTDPLGNRTLWKAGGKGPLPVTGKAWRIYGDACAKARELKRKVPTSVAEAVGAELRRAGQEPDVPQPVIPEPERVELPPVQNPPEPRKASGRPGKPDSALDAKGLYDRRWRQAKAQGPNVLTQFKADWKAGRVEGSPYANAADVAPPKAPEAPKARKATAKSEDRPEPGKVYALTDFAKDGPSIAAGNTWAESEVVEPVIA